MTTIPFLDGGVSLPVTSRASERDMSPAWDRWRSAIASHEDENVKALAQLMAQSDALRGFFTALFDQSPFLTDLMIREPEVTAHAIVKGCMEAVDHAFNVFDGSAPTGPEAATDEDLKAAMARTRRLKRRVALALALGDVTGKLDLFQVTEALSQVAEVSTDAVMAPILRGLARRGKLTVEDIANPLEGCGIFILGMGKLGAKELNYSSDIDLIVLFDDTVPGLEDVGEVQPWVVRLTRDLGRALEERTGDGYVFRIDLRLRPDPGATPLAMSVTAATNYYATIGQNWERAAMIKARVIGGDRVAGNRFLTQIRQFVWRKNLDFWTIQDIKAIKRQIATHRGGHAFEALGFNVKLGPGGIREIEFYAQVQQLIWGGRDLRMRKQRTLDALDALVETGHLDQPLRDTLASAYIFLRRVEHRLQMVGDHQTHVLPDTQAGLNHFVGFLGYASSEMFLEDFWHHTKAVHAHYINLFGDAPTLGNAQGSLVFTGAEDDPETTRTLKSMGYEEPERAIAMVKAWHHARIRATRSERARQILTEIIPALLEGFAQTPNPDQTLLRFEKFFSGLIAGVQFLSLLQMNPSLVTSLARIFGSAPSLAHQLGAFPDLIEALLADTLPDLSSSTAALIDDLDQTLARGRDYQDLLDLTRRWTNDQRFLAGIEVIEGRLHSDETGAFLTQVAEAVMARITPGVQAQFAERHGTVLSPETSEPAGPVIVALGRFGALDLNTGSDLDMMVIYDSAIDDMSDGEKPLPATVYFGRLIQRLVSALSVQTGEGPLYQIDLRLRPSGNKSPLAHSLESAALYYAADAWTWELMALTRARVVYGPPAAAAKVEAMLTKVRQQKRDPNQILIDVHDMRQRLAKTKGAPLLENLKQGPGGMVDIEFIVQFLLLRHGPELIATTPNLFTGQLKDTLHCLADGGVLSQEERDLLNDAYQLWRRLQGLLRLTQGGDRPLDSVEESLQELLTQTAGVENFDALITLCHRHAANVTQIYALKIGSPAEALIAAGADPSETIEGDWM